MKSTYLYQLFLKGRRNAMIVFVVIAFGVLGLAGYVLFLARQESLLSLRNPDFPSAAILFLILFLVGTGVGILVFVWRWFKHDALEHYPVLQRLSDRGDASHIEEELSHTDTIQRYDKMILTPSFFINESTFGFDVFRYEAILSVDEQTFPLLFVGFPVAMVGLYYALQAERGSLVSIGATTAVGLSVSAILYWRRTWIYFHIHLPGKRYARVFCKKNRADAFLQDLRARIGSSSGPPAP